MASDLEQAFAILSEAIHHGYPLPTWYDKFVRVADEIERLRAITNEGIVERIAQFVESWNGETRDGDTVNIAHEVRDQFASTANDAPVERLVEAEQWLRAISTWLLENDHDMTLPTGILDTEPLDIADHLAALSSPSGEPAEVARLHSLAKANNDYAKLLESERHKRARWFAGNIVAAGPDLPSRQKWAGLYSLAQQLLALTEADRAKPTPTDTADHREAHAHATSTQARIEILSDADAAQEVARILQASGHAPERYPSPTACAAALRKHVIAISRAWDKRYAPDGIGAGIIIPGECLTMLAAAKMLASLISSPPTVGEGWVAVPREPTEAMLDAAWTARLNQREGAPAGIVFAAAYRAMITAAHNPKGEA